MKQKELLQAIKNAPFIWVWVKYCDNDGCYVKAVKSHLLKRFSDPHYESIEFNAFVESNENVFIN